MSLPEENKPIYDEKVNEILRGLIEGKSRDDLAVTMGYTTYRSLDMYMRRHNFTWDRERQKYVPTYTRLKDEDLNLTLVSSSKAAQIISMFDKDGADAKTIAKRLGFTDYRELAAYMAGKGYEWSLEVGNYVKAAGSVENDDDSGNEFQSTDSEELDLGISTSASTTQTAKDVIGSPELERFLPLLEMLERNKGRLIDMLIPASDSGQVPRYVIPGIHVTKSVHMVNTLDKLVRDFSQEKNISQRDIFVVALVEFFRRYGYEREVEKLLGA